MTGVGTDAPHDLREFVTDTRKRIVSLERRQGGGGGGGGATAGGSVIGPGQIMAYGGTTAPRGWVLCDGRALSRTGYEALFTAIGTAFGAGDGSTTFNVPDLRGRVAVGRDAGQVEFDVLGETGGAKTHTLTIAQMPAHNHQQKYHNATYAQTAAAGLGGMTGGSGPEGFAAQNTVATGGDGAHNNLQPYQVTNWIISSGEVPPVTPVTAPGRGTTAQRDGLYPPPVSTADQVALANQQVIWFNTTKGYSEMYYATTALAGLTVRGLWPGIASGWFPVAGTLLIATRIAANGFQSVPSGGGFVNPNLTVTQNNVGGFTFGTNNIVMPVGGYWTVSAAVWYSGGSASSAVGCIVRLVGAPQELFASRIYFTGTDLIATVTGTAVLMGAGQAVELLAMSASSATNIYGDGSNRRTWLSLTYAGPPLANG